MTHEALDEQLHSDVRRPLERCAPSPSTAPGESGAFALDLRPAGHGFICLLPEPGGTKSYALRGMNSEFVVR